MFFTEWVTRFCLRRCWLTCIFGSARTGSLPGVEWALGMRSLQRLWVRKNPLTGALPDSWFSTPGVWQALNYIDLRYTFVGGPVPEITNGGTFFSTPKFTPKLLVDDSGKPGLCGPLPNPGPQFFAFKGEDLFASDSGFRLSTLPPCSSGKALSNLSMPCPTPPPPSKRCVGCIHAYKVLIGCRGIAVLVLPLQNPPPPPP